MMMIRTYVRNCRYDDDGGDQSENDTYVLSEQADDDARVWAFFGSVKRQGHDIELDAQMMYVSRIYAVTSALC